MDIDPILIFEDNYAKYFCTSFEDEKIIRFRDSLIPDMYDHNYTRIKQVNSADEIKLIVMQEIDFCVSEGRKFCNIYINGNVELPRVHELNIKSEETSYAFYAAENLTELHLKSRDDCKMERIVNDTMIAERLSLELSEYGKNHGEDFCKRKSERMKQVYLEHAVFLTLIHLQAPQGYTNLLVSSPSAAQRQRKRGDYCAAQGAMRPGGSRATMQQAGYIRIIIDLYFAE